jgi:hypothetical protein
LAEIIFRRVNHIFQSFMGASSSADVGKEGKEEKWTDTEGQEEAQKAHQDGDTLCHE